MEEVAGSSPVESTILRHPAAGVRGGPLIRTKTRAWLRARHPISRREIIPMLQSLRIRNLALLEEVELDFEPGFTAVT